MLQQKQKRLYSMSRAELIAAIYERVPNRYRRLINNARPDEIKVLGQLTGPCGRQKFLVIRVLSQVLTRQVLMLAITEFRHTPLCGQAGYWLRTGVIINVDWKNWLPDAYPHDIPERVAKRLMERAKL